MFIDFLCPVENQGVIVKTNSKTGEPYALFRLFNLSDQIVTAVSFLVRAFDAYGGELGEIRVDLSDLNAGPKSFFAEKKAVSLKDYAEAKHITVDFLSVDFAEGESYKKTYEMTEVIINESDYEEKMRLASVAGEDAYCYAQDQGTYWVCVCGRPNVAEDAECVRCGRNKKEVFEKFSSRGTINKVIEAQEKAHLEEEQKQAEAEAEKAALRNKKIKKFAMVGAACVVCVAVLIFLITFIINGVHVLQGNSAQKQGDYIKAYQHYRKAGSDKVGEVSEKLRGNTASNLLNYGFMAADEENIYYFDENCVVYKESKKTGEKAKLGDTVGYYLNVVDGWLYYLDPYTRQIVSRVKTDGTETQHLVESADSYFSDLFVVGNEVYYLAQELRDDLTPEMQEQIAMSGTTEAAYRNVLYRLRIGETKPEKVAEADILRYVVYKDRIYYLDRAETAVYSMNLKGEDHKKVIGGPVYAFDIADDILYYQDATPNQTTGFPVFTLIKAQLDGAYLDTVVSDRMAVNFCLVGDTVYYVGFDTIEDEKGILYKKTPDGEEVLIEGCMEFNIQGDYIFYTDETGKHMKTKFDKSGYEAVMSAENAETAPNTEASFE